MVKPDEDEPEDESPSAKPVLDLATSLVKIGVRSRAASAGALGRYVHAELDGVLAIAGLPQLAAPLKEAGLADVLVLSQCRKGHLVSHVDEEATAAYKSLVRVIRATEWYKGADDGDRVGFASLMALRDPLVSALHATHQNRMKVVQDEAAAASAATTDASKRPSAAPPAGEAESLRGMFENLTKALTAATSGRRDHPTASSIETKLPPSRAVLSRATQSVGSQLGVLPPVAVMPIEDDVYKAFAQLTSDPPRMAQLDTLELPVGGRSQDQRATKARAYTHERGRSRDDELSLLERYLTAHGLAGGVPAGVQYHVTEEDEAMAMAADPADPVVAYCRPDLKVDGSAGAARREDGGEDSEDEDSEGSSAVIAVFVHVMLFCMQCRTEARQCELTGPEARLFSDDIQKELDNLLFQDRRTLTRALSEVSPHTLARRYARTSPGNRATSPTGGGAPPKARGARGGGRDGRPKKVAFAKDDAGGAANAESSGDNRGLCFKYAKGECEEGEDCKFRHFLTAGEMKSAKGGGRGGGGGKRKR